MSSIKAVLRTKKNSDGTFPIAIRITKDRKTSFIHLVNIKETEWDKAGGKVKKSHPNSVRINHMIAMKLAEAADKALESESQKKDVTSKSIKAKIKSPKGASFFTFAELYLSNMKKRSYNREHTDRSRIKYFKEFLGVEDIALTEITPGLLTRFDEYLKGERKLKERTVANYMMAIQSVFRLAINEGATEEKYNPIGRGKYVIFVPASSKVGISREDLAKIEQVKLATKAQERARDIWLTSYYFAGMRISDVLRLRWSDFYNERLNYTMGKNAKPGSLKIPEKFMHILKKYEHTKEHPDDFIFPDLKGITDLKNQYEVERRISHAGKNYNKTLKQRVLPAAGVTASVSMHIARHTFATNAGDKIPIQMLQKLYRHTDIKTTIGYQANFINKDADDALDAVLNG